MIVKLRGVVKQLLQALPAFGLHMMGGILSLRQNRGQNRGQSLSSRPILYSPRQAGR